MHFLVKWKGYPTSDNSWEPRENLHADRLIMEYNKKKQNQAEPKKKGVKSRRTRTEEIIPFSSDNQQIPFTPREVPSSLSTSPTTPRSTALPALSKTLPDYRQFGLTHCGQCRLPREYLHTLRARGIGSGWTCRCDKTPSPTTSTDLPLGQTARDTQGFGRDAGRLLAREDSTTGDDTLGRVRPGATGRDDDEEEEDATDLTEEDPLEWAYSMMCVPKIEVLVTREVKRTVEANRQDDTQSGVSVPMKKVRESR